jgi:hypothetical protein
MHGITWQSKNWFIEPKAGVPLSHPLLTRFFLTPAFLALALAATLSTPLHAQTAKTLTILMLDGKTGKPIIPSNFLVRFDHLDAIHNESVRIGDDGLGTVTVPASASFLSVQATYSESMDYYVNCDAAMQKDVRTLHWYPIADILSTGVNSPNECSKGKYDDATRLAAKPGVFVFYVRKTNWHEMPAD